MKKILLVVLAVVLCVALIGCSAQKAEPAASEAAPAAEESAAEAPAAEESAAEAPAEEAQTFKVAVSLPPADNAWQASMAKFIKQYLEEKPMIEATIKSAVDAADQMNVMATFKDGGFDLIAILPVDGSELTAACEDVYASGIPTIIIDRNTEGDNKTSFVAGDNYDGGVQGARYIGEFFKGQEGIVGVELRSYAGTPIDLERHDGYVDTIAAEYPNITMIGEADGEFNSTAGFEGMSNLLAAYDHIDFVYSHDDEATTGAMTAIEQAGRTDIQIITGNGGTVTALNEIKADNTIHKETSGYFPGLIAKAAADTIEEYLTTGSCDKEVIIPGTAITVDNVDDYMQYAYE